MSMLDYCFDTAKGQRRCTSCGASISSGTRHMARHFVAKRGQYVQRTNFCRKCADKTLKKEQERLFVLRNELLRR